jgi:hypothetical protein
MYDARSVVHKQTCDTASPQSAQQANTSAATPASVREPVSCTREPLWKPAASWSITEYEEHYKKYTADLATFVKHEAADAKRKVYSAMHGVYGPSAALHDQLVRAQYQQRLADTRYVRNSMISVLGAEGRMSEIADAASERRWRETTQPRGHVRVVCISVRSRATTFRIEFGRKHTKATKRRLQQQERCKYIGEREKSRPAGGTEEYIEIGTALRSFHRSLTGSLQAIHLACHVEHLLRYTARHTRLQCKLS